MEKNTADPGQHNEDYAFNATGVPCAASVALTDIVSGFNA